MAPPRKHKYTDKHLKRLKENGISKNTFFSRIYRGWSVEDACQAKPQSKVEIPDWVRKEAKENGIPYKVLHARLTNGWSYERACRQGTAHKYRERPKVYAKAAEREMSDDEVIEAIGRIKYLNKRDFKEFPVIVPEPMRKRIEQMDMSVDEIEEVEVR